MKLINEFSALFEEFFIDTVAKLYKVTEVDSLTESGKIQEVFYGDIQIGLTNRGRRNPNDFDRNIITNQEQYDYRIKKNIPIALGDIIVMGNNRYVVRSIGNKKASRTFNKGIIDKESGHYGA